ncbi:hypothetical protein BJY01DRAFT_245206 [Aspergillus pseudoustus]|uniref:Uncharacterized protein n=1 Tax=Aspergillus pseudoustus TaxID=1810923 RepID=A0ABR4KFQ8_9EURO
MKLLSILTLIPALASAWTVSFYDDTSCSGLIGEEGDIGNSQCRAISGWSVDVLSVTFDTEGDGVGLTVYDGPDCSRSEQTIIAGRCNNLNNVAGTTKSYMVL